jgi:hypothetical protein
VVQYFITAGANVAVSHNLNKTGVHYWIATKTAACDIYKGSVTDTNSILNLASSASGVTVTRVIMGSIRWNEQRSFKNIMGVPQIGNSSQARGPGNVSTITESSITVK